VQRAQHLSNSTEGCSAAAATAWSPRRRAAWRLLAAALVTGGAVLASAPGQVVRADGSAYVLADVECDTAHDGVLDLTLVNDRTDQVAVFVVTDVHSSATASYTVPALSATAVTYTGLSDGVVVAPVAIDGADATVSKPVHCDAPVVDVLPAPQRAVAGSPVLPATGSASGGLLTGGVLVAAGMVASLLARRRYT